MGKRILIYSGDFLAASFIGWLYETLLTLAVVGKYCDRGYLDAPLCPIYGVGALMMLALFGRLHNKGAVFAAAAVTATALELAASYIIEAALGYSLWDYSRWPLELDGRVSALSSVIFGLMGVLLVFIIHPGMEKLADMLFHKRN